MSHHHKVLFDKVQDDLKRPDVIPLLKPEDVSMILWSFVHVDVAVDPDTLSTLMNFIAGRCDEFSKKSLIVTCVALARLGFAQQPVLVQLYRTLYAWLPSLSDSQLSFTFFLYSTSGVRDEALLQRFIFECKERISRLRGQD